MIVIIGAGYVGLVTSACFAEMGNQVICIDIDEKKIETLNAGKIPFYEPSLNELVSHNREAGRLLFTSDYEAVSSAHICFLALPTPSCADGSCDLSYLFDSVQQVAEKMEGELILVVKSTVPVGTTECLRPRIQNTLQLRQINHSFELISNPEFLREGSAIADCLKPDRIVIGAEHVDGNGVEVMKKLYAPFQISRDRIFVMGLSSAELSKYAANAMLATRISFINELARLCETFGAQINDVRLVIGSDHRIGMHYLCPGIGWGGSCLPKDIHALQALARSHSCNTPLLDSVQTINELQRFYFIQKIMNYFGSLNGKIFAIWGLSFKPNTDDLREAPSLYLIRELHQHGVFLKVYDPVSLRKAKKILDKYDQIAFCSDEYVAAEGADAILLVTEWKQFRLVDFPKIIQSMRGRAFFDGRNQYVPTLMQEAGFDYFCMGISSPMMAQSR